MNNVKSFFKRELLELQYLFVNYIICNIPIWIVRKILYICCGIRIGNSSRIMMKVKIYSPHKISIGKRTIINEYSYLDGRGGITIGDDVTIATYAKLVTGSHNIDSDYFEYNSKPICIESNSSVFSDALILGGAILHSGCVIGAKSLVRSGEYEKNGIYAGNPAVFIRCRKTDVNYKQESVRLLFR